MEEDRRQHLSRTFTSIPSVSTSSPPPPTSNTYTVLTPWSQATGEWEEVQVEDDSAPTARYFHSAIVWNKAIWVFGGLGLESPSDSEERNLGDLYFFPLGTFSHFFPFLLFLSYLLNTVCRWWSIQVLFLDGGRRGKGEEEKRKTQDTIEETDWPQRPSGLSSSAACRNLARDSWKHGCEDSGYTLYCIENMEKVISSIFFFSFFLFRLNNFFLFSLAEADSLWKWHYLALTPAQGWIQEWDDLSKQETSWISKYRDFIRKLAKYRIHPQQLSLSLFFLLSSLFSHTSCFLFPPIKARGSSRPKRGMIVRSLLTPSSLL